VHPEDAAKIEAGVIYVAPPDHHILIDDSHVAVKKGPKENGFRPSIDALFRSAAYSYGPGAIGVILSGALHDGTSGLWTIKRLGGVAIVQDPYEAEYASMPRSALEYVEADYRVRSKEIAVLLTRLAQDELTQEADIRNDDEEGLEQRIAKEVQIAAGTSIPQNTVLKLGELTPFTCPECYGSLVRITEGKLSRFRCHTGHGFTEHALLEAAMQVVGQKMWQITRSLQEIQMLLEHMGQHIRDVGDPAGAEKFFVKARELEKQATHFQQMSVGHKNLSEQQPAD
jgi:two-component system, chemotaxis family, protein-glutamate methylesterase/glutaminase